MFNFPPAIDASVPVTKLEWPPLTVPANAQFRFDAQTSHGHITNAFSKERPSGKAKNHLAGTVGQDPSTFIELRTSNGSIALRQMVKREPPPPSQCPRRQDFDEFLKTMGGRLQTLIT